MEEHLINTLCCDGCGRTVSIPLVEVAGDVPVEEMKQFVEYTFFAVKRAFAARGWYTSVGGDLCPECCKRTGVAPGYSDTGLRPETRIRPRNQKEPPARNVT